MSLQDTKNKLNRAVSRYNSVLSTIKEEANRIKTLKEKVEHAEMARSFLQETAEKMQNQAHTQIAKIVSRCLSLIFDEPYELKIQFEQKRGKTEAQFFYVREGNLVEPLVVSGGVRDVVSIGLRLASIRMNLPPVRPLLILDEPFQGLSKTNLEKIGTLLESLAADMGIQMILATHDSQLQIGKVIEIEKG